MSCFIRELLNIVEDEEVIKLLEELDGWINDIKEEVRELKAKVEGFV